MQQTNRKRITEKQWKHAAVAYELGTKHARQIAADLGVSPATVSREFKRRGCIKARRVAETVAELEAALDAKAARRREVEEAAAAKRNAEIDELIGEMMKSIIAAERTGKLSSAESEIARVGNALGVKPLR